MQACGAKYRILDENIDETDVDDVVVALVNMAKRVSFSSIKITSLYISLTNETSMLDLKEYFCS